MSLVKHYLQTASQLCQVYDGAIPFHFVLKQFFSQHKKYGSRDRKWITGLCYSFLRLGKAMPTAAVTERLEQAWFLCSLAPNRLLEDIKSSWNELATLPVEKKMEVIDHPFSIEEIAPFASLLSEGISATQYAAHFLKQPDVFIRIRPRNEKPVTDRLKSLDWNFELHGHSVRLPPGSAVDKHFLLDKQVVVQDLHSQKVGDIIREVFKQENFVPAVMWDCCAASGGKSIMMKDLYPGLQITVSDIRPSILQNLGNRFKDAGISSYQSFVADLTNSNGLKEVKKQLRSPLHLIIADMPCTGSGTWARTPEQLYFFKEDMIASYASKQIAIASNALAYLSSGGYFVYVTCSVFEQENEAVVAQLTADYSMQLLSSHVLDGTGIKSDSMFVTILKKR